MASSLENLFGHETQLLATSDGWGEPNESEGEYRRALIVAAHPDDADFGAAGTAHLLTDLNWEVRYLIITDGSKGSDDPSLSSDELVTIRKQEQLDAANLLGVQSVRFLDFTDGELVRDLALLEAVVREIRSFEPFAVYTHDPEPVIIRNSFINHSDHRATGLATVDAVYPAARDRLNFPDHLKRGLAPHKVRELYLWGTNDPNFEVDISNIVDTKISALVAHDSQFNINEEFIEQMRNRWINDDGLYVEEFRRISIFR